MKHGMPRHPLSRSVIGAITVLTFLPHMLQGQDTQTHYSPHSPQEFFVEFAPDGHYKVTMDHNGRIDLWDSVWNRIGPIDDAPSGVVGECLRFLKKGTLLAAGRSGTTTLFELRSNSGGQSFVRIKQFDPEVKGTRVNDVALLPDDNTLIESVSWQRPFGPNTATLESDYRINFLQKPGFENVAIQKSSKNRLPTNGYYAYSLKVDVPSLSRFDWLDGTEKLVELPRGFRKGDPAVLSSDATTIVQCSPDLIRVMDVGSGQEKFTFKDQKGIVRCVLSSDGKRLASLGNDPKRQVGIWDLEKGVLVQSFAGFTAFHPPASFYPLASVFVFSPDHKYFLIKSGPTLSGPLERRTTDDKNAETTEVK